VSVSVATKVTVAHLSGQVTIKIQLLVTIVVDECVLLLQSML